MGIAMIVATLGCATATREIGHDQDRTIHRPSSSIALDAAITPLPYRASDILTAAELATTPGLGTANAYDAVIRLRASFLHPRGARTGTIAARGMFPSVFVNGTYYGDLETLRLIAIFAVEQMQYVRSFDAMQRYGPDYSAGVILVTLKRGMPPRR